MALRWGRIKVRLISPVICFVIDFVVSKVRKGREGGREVR